MGKYTKTAILILSEAWSIKIIKNIKKIKIIKSWVEPTEENSRGDNDPAAIRGDNN